MSGAALSGIIPSKFALILIKMDSMEARSTQCEAIHYAGGLLSCVYTQVLSVFSINLTIYESACNPANSRHNIRSLKTLRAMSEDQMESSWPAGESDGSH